MLLYNPFHLVFLAAEQDKNNPCYYDGAADNAKREKPPSPVPGRQYGQGEKILRLSQVPFLGVAACQDRVSARCKRRDYQFRIVAFRIEAAHLVMIDFETQNIPAVGHYTNFDILAVPGNGYLVLMQFMHLVLTVDSEFG